MHLSTVTHVLQALDESKLKRLKEYIHTPYFHNCISAVALFDYLAPLHPVFTEKKIKPEAISAKEKKLPTYLKQRKAGVELLKIINEFIALENWKRDKHNVMLNQLAGYKDLNLTGLFYKEYASTMRQLNETSEQDLNTFFYRHLYTELSLSGTDACMEKTLPGDLNPVLNTLDEFAALKKLRYLCEVLSRNRQLGITEPDNQLPSLLKTLEPYSGKEYITINLFANIYKMLSAKTYRQSERYYREVKKFIEGLEEPELMPTAIESIGYCINHCLYWLNHGYHEAEAEYLWWFNLKMKHGLILEQGIMLPVTFRNIINIAAAQNQSDWMSRFIVLYAQYLPKEHSEANMAFAKGLLFFVQKKYKEAVRHLMMADAKEDILFACTIRRWQFMCLYECDCTDANTLENHLTSFEKYIERHEAELNRNKAVFLRFILHALSLLKSNKPLQLNNDLEKLQNEEYFAGKHWLLKQLESKKPNFSPHRQLRPLSIA